ncbi:hypothetical protein J8F10_27015 [Gemmata sp. G18]|uniref:VCBS repeat-containing protein n=1 Tax=Gemmata palustris TaxID=2822762 RepID=A0ABS5BZ11_9BACT|nr:hypothetical protein [Gemmata palustris]MBP3958913.1 hypothetical protein [Gemmata palustris]
MEDRTTPTFLAPAASAINVNNTNRATGGLSLAVGDLLPDPENIVGLVRNEYVTGTGPGTESLVRVWSDTGVLRESFNPFPGFKGGINVAVGDVTGDGANEIIVAVAANGPPQVKVFNASGQLLSTFFAFDTGFLGGLNIAVGNVLGGIGGGGFSGGTTSGNFKQEIIIGAAAGGSPHVLATDGSGTVLRSFLAFDLGYRGGVTVAAGSVDTQRSNAYAGTGVDTNAYDEIIVGAATNVPHVKVFSVWQGGQTELQSFFAFDPSIPANRVGVTVAAGSTDNNRGAEVYVSLNNGSQVRVFNGETGSALGEFLAFPTGYTRVVNMTVGRLSGAYNPSDDDTFINGNPFFQLQDLVAVTGDGAFNQQPRLFFAGVNSAAGFNGP